MFPGDFDSQIFVCVCVLFFFFFFFWFIVFFNNEENKVSNGS